MSELPPEDIPDWLKKFANSTMLDKLKVKGWDHYQAFQFDIEVTDWFGQFLNEAKNMGFKVSIRFISDYPETFCINIKKDTKSNN